MLSKTAAKTRSAKRSSEFVSARTNPPSRNSTAPDARPGVSTLRVSQPRRAPCTAAPRHPGSDICDTVYAVRRRYAVAHALSRRSTPGRSDSIPWVGLLCPTRPHTSASLPPAPAVRPRHDDAPPAARVWSGERANPTTRPRRARSIGFPHCGPARSASTCAVYAAQLASLPLWRA